VHIQDTLAAPVGGGKDLKTSVLTQVVAYADSLPMTVDRALEDCSIRGEEHEALPTGDDGDKVAVVGVDRTDDDLIGMVDGNRQLPQQVSIRVDHIVAAENLILAVAIEVVGIGEVAGIVVGEFPDQVELVVIDPKPCIPILDQEVRRPVLAVIVLTFFAVLGGVLTFQDIEAMCTYKEKYFRKFLPLKAGIPSHDTFNRVFSLLDMDQFNDVLLTFVMNSIHQLRSALKIPEPQMAQLCVDSKEARASSRQEDAEGRVRRNIQTLDDENATVNRRASGNLSIMKKMALSLYKMMKPLENSKTLSNIKREALQGSLEKKE